MLYMQVKFMQILLCLHIYLSIYLSIYLDGSINLNASNSTASTVTTSGGGAQTSNTSISATGGKYYQPPFKHNEKVSIDIVGSLYEIKKRLLGTNASKIIKIVDEVK